MPADSFSEALVGFLRQEQQVSALQDRVAKLFEEARDDVYRYLLTLGLHPPSAQEAVQEVFLRFYTALKKGEDIQNARGWIFRVAHNYGLTMRERQAAESPLDPDLELRLASQTEDPERGLIEREKLARFHHAVQQLSEQQKRCLFLRMEGLRYPEIGATLGISPSAVGEFLRRALVRLRKVNDD
ncbi:MAG TPA: RNA polymerase sigma factor [Bryobacteraceae bacterium]|jgi:RNA polymerase sigma-70 factor (ECF subfamily)|nr:RNA polymerase sigma factor [Bryobacteraceae bacterium]